VKTAVFQYTHKTEVDSSVAHTVYYSADEQTMAIQFHNGSSAFYGSVPESFYRGFVTLSSIGGTYNSYVKKVFPNVSGGTVYNVNYVDASEKKEETSESRYLVHGYIRVSGTFTAASRGKAMEQFLDSLTEDGYDEEEIAVTEVEIVG